ncbi:MAG: GDP-mannose 4,6-dehydratase [Candidatus Krumholzibacteria bacterium]|nr:GDP-mannose 4,6-dehydratase [Candidatus Krumholzibacteria bacterium]
MRSLITGACGFVGSYLASELASAGHEVIATDVNEFPADEGADRRRSGAEAPWRPAFGREIAYRRCDILDADAVKALIADTRPDNVFHLAAQSSAARSLEEPRLTLETNVFGTLNVLEGVRRLAPVCPGAETRSGKIRILSVGSCEEYGRRSPGEMPLGEKSPVEPASPYAVSKAAQTMLAMQYARSFGLDVVATRSFSHTGPAQSERFVLPSFARQCAEIKAGKRPPVVKVGNIGVVRDFLDVRDVVRAYRMMADEVDGTGVYNVCSGRGLKLADALDILVRFSGASARIEQDSALARPADIEVLVGDNAKLRRACGWEPRHSTETMLQALFEYWERLVRER